MAYGMTYEQFWYGEPRMVKAYEQAFLLKRRMRNEEMWIQGMYVCNAVSVAVNNCLSKHRANYLKAPLDFYPKTQAERQEEIRQERLTLVKQLSMFAAKFKKKQKKGTDQNGKP